MNGGLLSEVFPGFVSLWNDSTWKVPLWEAVYWYIQANGQNYKSAITDAGIILAQTALELLAWTHCVQHRRMVSARAFERGGGLRAADKLRLLATSLDVPLDIPPHLLALNAKPGEKWHDAMHAITDVRNALVHPPAKTVLPKDSYLEAWNLSLWYLEMVLLRLCGHMGKYSNRLHLQK